MMSHPKVEDLSIYLDSKLTIAESQQVEAHLERCDTCRHRLQSMQNVVRNLAALERQTPPPILGYQLKRMSALEATRPNLVERLEKGASRLNSENAVLPMFGVVVALVVIIYLLTWAFYRDRSSVSPTGLESERPMLEQAVEIGGIEQGRVVGDRTFDLIGDTWTERGLDIDAEVIRLSAEDPEIQQWLEVHPELRDLSARGEKVRLRLQWRVVEVHFGARD